MLTSGPHCVSFAVLRLPRLPHSYHVLGTTDIEHSLALVASSLMWCMQGRISSVTAVVRVDLTGAVMVSRSSQWSLSKRYMSSFVRECPQTRLP